MIGKIMFLWKKVGKVEIIKVFSFTSISTLVRMLTGFISVKVVALIIGPAGVALLGQLNSFSTIVLNFASFGINSGVTKYVAENSQAEKQLKRYISAALRIVLIGSLFTGSCLIIFHNFLSWRIMKSQEYGYLFILFGLTILLYALNNLLLSILNGFKQFKRFVQINIADAIIGLLFTISLVYFWTLKGALISAVTYQSIMLFVTVGLMKGQAWMKLEFFREKFDFSIAKKYMHYALMTLVTVATVPVSQLIVRSHIITNLSLEQAGWWEAMNRISAMYLMVITSSFGVYYLPRLSELKEKNALRIEIFKAYKVIVPFLITGFSLIYFLRFFIIRLLFNSAFYPMQSLVGWQLIGDFFKVSSWLLAFLMVAKSMTKTFIITEIFFSGLLVFLSFWLVRLNGLNGIVQAYLINYFIYFLLMIFIFRRLIFNGNAET